MSRTAITALQVVLVVGFLLLLLAQVLVLPGLAEDYARRFPEAAFLRTPVLVLAISTLACGQVAVVCIGRLLAMVGEQRIFDPAAYRYVDVFIGASAAAGALVLVVGGYVSATAGGPLWLSCAVVAMVCAGTALLMVVMRALLRQATEQQAELADLV